jgi:hypothetical protein
MTALVMDGRLRLTCHQIDSGSVQGIIDTVPDGLAVKQPTFKEMDPMFCLLVDECPVCGGNDMTMGDYVCWGWCFACTDKQTKEAQSE